jgi:hypothetical protein
MNHDGQTDVNDFLLLRGALNGQISAAAMNALFDGQLHSSGGAAVVPEPPVATLALIAAVSLLLLSTRRVRAAC